MAKGQSINDALLRAAALAQASSLVLAQMRRSDAAISSEDALALARGLDAEIAAILRQAARARRAPPGRP
ncbi:MAG: hypothetical protein ACM31O_03910, partial [Bacteroidota bacterium]